ncbi:hypothetical protein ACJ73_10346 [Blastomyces percursus]|uniref:Uncharacterized protein n=1 Tax=Blastomyces percursus TaxID=1658174 RepID=A0A1J9Q0D3_9EURO|nr:hypothetical protein ACJ73_10346 [Blastomyces percursus]
MSQSRTINHGWHQNFKRRGSVREWSHCMCLQQKMLGSADVLVIYWTHIFVKKGNSSTYMIHIVIQRKMPQRAVQDESESDDLSDTKDKIKQEIDEVSERVNETIESASVVPETTEELDGQIDVGVPSAAHEDVLLHMSIEEIEAVLRCRRAAVAAARSCSSAASQCTGRRTYSLSTNSMASTLSPTRASTRTLGQASGDTSTPMQDATVVEQTQQPINDAQEPQNTEGRKRHLGDDASDWREDLPGNYGENG